MSKLQTLELQGTVPVVLKAAREMICPYATRQEASEVLLS